MPSADKVVVVWQHDGHGQHVRAGTTVSAPPQQFSIRGLPVQGLSSDFFDTLATSDFYNTERVTVSRGPNSILAGVGGPRRSP